MPFPQLQTVNLDTLVSTTLQNYQKRMVTNIITSVPAARYLMDENSRKTMGGTRINIQVLYGYNSATTFYNFSDYIGIAPQESVTQAQYKWANLTTPIVVFGEDQAANAGEWAIQGLVESKIKQAELSLARLINQTAYGDGTGYFGAAPDGLANLVYATATPANPPSGATGGISATVFSFWRNNANVAPGSYAVNGSQGSGSPDYQLRMWDQCTDGALKPTVLLSDFGTFESYQQNVHSVYRTMENNTVDLGFEHAVYKGTPWAPDRDCPTGTQYYLNTAFLYSVVDSGRFFQQTDWMPSQQQDGKVMRIHLRYNNVCSNRMLQGVITNWS